MKKIIPIIGLIAVLLSACQNTNPLAKVQVEQGVLEGAPGADASVMVYKGVPFAAPPVGELRWQPPQPPEPWDGVRMANEFSANPMQLMRDGMGPWTTEYQPKGEISEDCLYLNIWTAAKSADEKRPVMMYIPGGGYRDGSGNVPVYNGENLAKKGIVVVTVNYRVGVFGFFAHPELTAESEHHSSGNYGLLDNVAALEWIRKNIAAFGGDPETVTIMGQSAGAASVHGLTASPLAKGLFVRAIPQSGSRVRLGPGQDLESAEQAGLKFAKAIGAESLAELRAIPADELHNFAYDHYSFRPIVDGWFLPKSVDDIIAAGEQNDVATLTGMVADEGSSGDKYGKLSADEFTSQVKRQVGKLADTILELYPSSTQEECTASQLALTRELSMVSIYLWAKNRTQTSKTNAYLYIFTHPQPGPTQDIYMAFHSSDLPYVFNNLDPSYKPWTDDDAKISKIMSSYWVNFIKTGDPNSDGLPEWPAFNDAPGNIMVLGDNMESRPIASPEKFELLIKVMQK